jgi:hypothetical protein
MSEMPCVRELRAPSNRRLWRATAGGSYLGRARGRSPFRLAPHQPWSGGSHPEGVNAVTPQQSQTGGSGSFLVLADDGRRYWCKVDYLTLAR